MGLAVKARGGARPSLTRAVTSHPRVTNATRPNSRPDT